MQHMVNFADDPAIGTKIHKGDTAIILTLENIEAHVRRDGSEGTIMTWLGSDGVKYTSGLRSKGISSPVKFMRCNLPQNRL